MAGSEPVPAIGPSSNSLVLAEFPVACISLSSYSWPNCTMVSFEEKVFQATVGVLDFYLCS
jgi:hypothetical protein